MDTLQETDPGLVLFDPDENYKLVAYTSGDHPKNGNAVIAADVKDPYAVITARGGYDLIYLPKNLSKQEVRRRAQLILDELFVQDYAGGIFVDETSWDACAERFPSNIWVGLMAIGKNPLSWSASYR